MENNTYIGARTPVIVNGKLYEFGHYTGSGCVVYEIGEFASKHPNHFRLEEIHLPAREKLEEYE